MGPCDPLQWTRFGGHCYDRSVCPMKRESIAFAVAGMAFGLLAGWMIGTEQAATRTSAASPSEAASVPASPSSESTRRATLVDEAEVNALKSMADREPSNPKPRTDLANLYFDAERFVDAIPWYTEAITLNPNDANASTNLGISYYYTNQPDKALEQFDHSLKVDPKHTKTLLNVGIVKAFGKQDLNGATEAWEQLIRLTPDSPEGPSGEARARQPAIGSFGHRQCSAEPRCLMLRFVLLILFLVLVARVFRRVGGGAFQGVTGRQRRSDPPQRGVQMVRDPVCGTYVIPERALSASEGGTSLFFCSARCREKYHARTA